MDISQLHQISFTTWRLSVKW